jgi:hypothetical protein
MGERSEPVLVQALIPQFAVETFEVGVLVQLSRLDHAQLDPLPMRAHHHHLGVELSAVSRPDDLRLAPQRTDPIEHSGTVIVTHRMLDRHSERLVRRVIDHRQALESATVDDSPIRAHVRRFETPVVPRVAFTALRPRLFRKFGPRLSVIMKEGTHPSSLTAIRSDPHRRLSCLTSGITTARR